jgi:hypothetical protein
MMRDWCWEIVHGSRCRVIACCLRCAAFSWLVGNGQGGGVRPGESRAQAPREPARRILFLPCMQGQQDRHGTVEEWRLQRPAPLLATCHTRMLQRSDLL